MVVILLGISLSGNMITEEKQEVIKIGAIAPLSGDGGLTYGIPAKEIVDLRIKQINEQGGINGKQIKVIWEDGQCSSKGGLNAAQKLIEFDDLKVIIGPVCSDEVLGALNYTESKKAILMLSLATSPEISNFGEYLFRVIPSDSASAKVLAQHINENYESVGIISENDGYAIAFKNEFKNNLKDVKIVGEEIFDSNAKDLRSQIKKVNEKEPQAIFISPQTAATAGLLVKQLKEQNVETQLFSNELFLLHDLSIEYQEYIQGLIISKQVWNEENLELLKYLENFNREYKEASPLGAYSAYVVDSVDLLLNAIEECGERDTKCMKDYYYNMRLYEGLSGDIRFDSRGDVYKDYILEQFNGKSFVEIGKS